MKRILKKFKTEQGNIFSILSTTIIGSFTSLLMTLAFANLIDPQTLGTYQYIVSIVSIIGGFTLSGLLMSIIRAIGRKDYFFLKTARKYTYIGSIPALVISAAVFLYYFAQGNWWLGISIFVSSLLYVSMLCLYRFNAIYVALDEIKTANFLLKLYAIAPLIIVLPALFYINNAYLLAILYFSSLLVAFEFSIWKFKMRKREDELCTNIVITDEVNIKNSSYLSFAIHQSLISVMNNAAAHIDKIIVFQMLGAHQTAIYFIAISVPNRFRNIIKQFESYIFARFSKHPHDAVRNGLTRKFLYILLLTVPLYISYILISPIIFKTFIPQYVDSVQLSQIFAITLFAGAMIVPQSLLKAHADSKQFYFSSIYYSISKPILIFIGIYFGNIEGAIIGSAVSLITYMFVIYFLAMTFTNKKIS